MMNERKKLNTGFAVVSGSMFCGMLAAAYFKEWMTFFVLMSLVIANCSIYLICVLRLRQSSQSQEVTKPVHEKPKYNNSGLGYYAQEFTENKKQVSDVKWLMDGLVTYLLAGMIAYLVYSLNENRFENAGLLAVGGTLAMFVFISQSEKRSGPIMWLLTKVFVICWLVLEVASIAGSYMSASNGHELNQHRENKIIAQNKIAELRQDKKDIQNSRVSDATKMYRKSEKDIKIESLENNAGMIISSNEGKYFEDLSKLTGIANMGQIYQITLSALLVLAGSMLISLRNGIWCNWTLNLHLKQSAKTMEIMASCEGEKPTENENVSPEDLEIKGGEEKEPTGKHKTGGNYEAAKTLIEKDFDRGFNIPAPKLKAATGTTAPHQRNAIIEQLIGKGIVIKKGASVKKYYRTTAKEQAEKTMKNTSKFLKLVIAK